MEKIYTSTRNKALARTPKEAILKGIAEDGGLFVYDALDTLHLPLQDMMQMSYEQMAETILQLLLPDFTKEEVADCVFKAYNCLLYTSASYTIPCKQIPYGYQSLVFRAFFSFA